MFANNKNFLLVVAVGIAAVQSVNAVDCNDPDIIRINYGPIKEFFVNPNAWQIAVIVVSGVLILSALVFLVRNCRITCDRRSYNALNRDSAEIDKKSQVTDLESLELGIKNEDEKYVPKSSFRIANSSTPQPMAPPSSRSPSVRSTHSQRSQSFISVNNDETSNIVSELLAEGLPIVIIQQSEGSRPVSALPDEEEEDDIEQRSVAASRASSVASKSIAASRAGSVARSVGPHQSVRSNTNASVVRKNSGHFSTSTPVSSY